MRRRVILVLLILNMLSPIYLAGVGDSTDGVFNKEVDLKEINEFMRKMEETFKKHKVVETQTFVQIGDEWEEASKIYNLNESEYLEIQNILTSDKDLMEIFSEMTLSKIPFDEDVWVKGLIFYGVGDFLMIKWKKELPSLEAVLVERILSIISKVENPRVVKYWITRTGSILLDINNEKLPLSNENRSEVCDRLLEIFRDENGPNNLRMEAVRAWVSGEKRGKEAVEVFDMMVKDENLFEKFGTRFASISRKIQKDYYKQQRIEEKKLGIRIEEKNKISIVDEKMFNVLENSDSYSVKILNTVVEYFSYTCASYDEKTKKRLNGILQSKVEKEKDEKLKEKYNYILNKRLKDEYDLYFGIDEEVKNLRNDDDKE